MALLILVPSLCLVFWLALCQGQAEAASDPNRSASVGGSGHGLTDDSEMPSPSVPGQERTSAVPGDSISSAWRAFEGDETVVWLETSHESRIFESWQERLQHAGRKPTLFLVGSPGDGLRRYNLSLDGARIEGTVEMERTHRGDWMIVRLEAAGEKEREVRQLQELVSQMRKQD